MNLNKSLACLLSAATFISSMPNIEAEDNKFKKVFNTIINLSYASNTIYVLSQTQICAGVFT